MECFAALADPTRRRIYELLAKSDRVVGEIAGEFTLSQPAVSKHLRVMREAGLVSREIRGQRRLYRLDPEGLRELDRWVSARRRAWEHRLNALEAHLESRQKRPHRREVE